MSNESILKPVFDALTSRLADDAKRLLRRHGNHDADPRSTLYVAAMPASIAVLWFDKFDGRPRVTTVQGVPSRSPILQAADLANSALPRLSSCQAKRALISLPRYPDDDLSTWDAAAKVATMTARAIVAGLKLPFATVGAEHVAEWEADLADLGRVRINVPDGIGYDVASVIRLADASSGILRYGLKTAIVWPMPDSRPREVPACQKLTEAASTRVH